MTRQGTVEEAILSIANTLRVPRNRLVVLGSAAMYLAAKAVGQVCRKPRDIDLLLDQGYIDWILSQSSTAERIRGYTYPCYNIRVGEWSVDIGTAWGSTSAAALKNGAQHTEMGIPFASLTHVRQFKAGRNRQSPNEKDAADILFIDQLLGSLKQNSFGLVCTVEAATGNTNATAQAARLLPGSFQATIHESDATKLRQLSDQGLETVNLRYGNGAPPCKFLRKDPQNSRLLYFNAGKHGWQVRDSSRKLTAKLGLGGFVRSVFDVAAAKHDVRQECVISDPTNRTGADELASAQEVNEDLRRSGFSAVAALLATYFIMGTQVTTNGSIVTGQASVKFDASEYPHNNGKLVQEAMLAAQIGGCSDMGYVYKDKELGLWLFAQRLGLEWPNVPDLTDPRTRKLLGKHLKGQCGFLRDGVIYPIKEARELFAGNRDEYKKASIKQADDLYLQWQHGDTPSAWAEFIAQIQPGGTIRL